MVLVLVVQSTHQAIQYVALMEPCSNSINNSADVGGAIAPTNNTVYLALMEAVTLSITQHVWVIQWSYFYMDKQYTDIQWDYLLHQQWKLWRSEWISFWWCSLKSTFSMLPNTTVYWENNHAKYIGGAIYVSPISYCTSCVLYGAKQECFFQLYGQNMSNGISVQFVFKNNSPDVAGSVTLW